MSGFQTVRILKIFKTSGRDVMSGRALTLAIPKMKSDFYTENKKCMGSKLNFLFYTCLPHFTLGVTILATTVLLYFCYDKIAI